MNKASRMQTRNRYRLLLLWNEYPHWFWRFWWGLRCTRARNTLRWLHE